MSQDFYAVCKTCQVGRWVGKSALYGSHFGMTRTDTGGQMEAAEWIFSHAGDLHDVAIIEIQSVPESIRLEDEE
jgi:hypothetical protein